MTVAARLAAFAVETPSDAIPVAVRARAALHLLDVVGCGIAAVGLDAGGHASAVAVEQGGAPEASLLGADARVPAPLAALANGTRCHALDFDDTHEAGICHASAVVAPAALAVAEARGADAAAALDAYLLGCEVAVRIAVAAADGLYARGYHPTGVCGAFGAAAAAARLLGLDARTAADALGVVGSFASGLLEFLSDGSGTKPLHAGWAAQAGVQAARLAAAGATGPASVVEGDFGLLRSHAGERGRAEAICDALGERWEIAAMSLKPFPACHFAHASTWAAAELAAEHGLAAADVEAVVARIPAEGLPLVLEPLARKQRPQTPYDGKFSLPFAIAHRLVHGELGLTSFSAHAVADPRVLALAARIRHEPIAESDGEHSRFAGGVRLLAGGREHDRFLAHAPGSPGNPLSDAWVRAKFRANAELGTTPEAAAALERLLCAPAELPSLEPVAALLRGARNASG